LWAPGTAGVLKNLQKREHREQHEGKKRGNNEKSEVGKNLSSSDHRLEEKKGTGRQRENSGNSLSHTKGNEDAASLRKVRGSTTFASSKENRNEKNPKGKKTYWKSAHPAREESRGLGRKNCTRTSVKKRKKGRRLGENNSPAQGEEDCEEIKTQEADASEPAPRERIALA